MSVIKTAKLNLNFAEHAIKKIKRDFGDDVSIDAKSKDLYKFGKNSNVGNPARSTLWYTGQDQANETYVFRNLIDSFSSASASDTGIRRIEGHYVGDDISVSSLTQTSGIATCITSTEHGGTTGDWVYISGANESEYNGIVQITVIDSNIFTYSVSSGATSPATGTIIATNQNKTFISQEITANGTSRVALDRFLARATRIFVSNQNKAVDNVGENYVYENTSISSGKPVDTTKIHLTLPAAENQSFKSSTSISQYDYFIISRIAAGYPTKTGSNTADIRLEIRELGGVFRPASSSLNISTGTSDRINFEPYLIVPKNADVRLTAVSSGSSQEISGIIQGFLAKII